MRSGTLWVLMSCMLGGCALYESVESYYQCDHEGAVRAGEVCRDGYWRGDEHGGGDGTSQQPHDDADTFLQPHDAQSADTHPDGGNQENRDGVDPPDGEPLDGAHVEEDAADARGEDDGGEIGERYPGVGPRETTLRASGPIALQNGMRVTGRHISSEDGPCITGNTVTDVLIADNKIGPCGDEPAILLNGAATDVTIEHNSFEDVSNAIHLSGSSSNRFTNIQVNHNLAAQLGAPPTSDDPGTTMNGQFLNMTGGATSDVVIRCNISDQPVLEQESNAGVAQHIYLGVKGSKTSPVLVEYNKLRGTGSRQNSAGISTSSRADRLLIQGNLIFQTGQYGLVVDGATYFSLIDNIVYSPTPLPGATAGISLPGLSFICSGELTEGNRVFFVDEDGEESHAQFRATNFCSPSGWDTENTWGDTDLSEELWDMPISACD